MPDRVVDVDGGEALDGFIGALLDDDAEALYERAPCGYVSTTPDGLIVKVNQTFLSWTGYRREEVVGRRRFADLLSPGGRIYHETHYAPMLAMQGQAREIALDIVHADGHRLPALVNAVLELDGDGAPQVVRTALFDATHRRRYERELLEATRRAEESEARAKELSRTLQKTLMPHAPPAIAGLELAAAYRPAGTGDEVGGDFYDVFEIGTGDWVVAVGDVQGKGVAAAVVTTLVRDTLRAAAVRHPAASEMLETANEVLLRHDADRFCTVVLLRLRRAVEGWSATVSRAGHSPPLLVRAGQDPTELGRPGPLLGVFDAPRFADVEVHLRPGDAVVLYTDGVTEAHRPVDDEWFGEARLRRAVTGAPPSAEALVGGLLDEVLAFQSGLPRDDIALVGVRVPDA